MRSLTPSSNILIFIIISFIRKFVKKGLILNKCLLCDGARARHLVRGSLRTWHMYIDVASPPSAPHLDIFVIQHLFKPIVAFVQASV